MRVAILSTLMLIASASPALAHHESIGDRSNRRAYRDVYIEKHYHHPPRHRHYHWHGDGSYHYHPHRKHGNHHRGHHEYRYHRHPRVPFLNIEIH